MNEEGKDIDSKKLMAEVDLDAVKKTKDELDDTDTLKAYYAHFQEEMDYGTIRLALAIISKEG